MGLIKEELIAQIVDRSDIVEVIAGYVPLKKAGRNFKANCPFHNEKTPSFVVNPDKQIYHCFGCGVGGNVINFVMKQERLEFPEAVRFLARKAGIVIPEEQHSSPSNENIRQALIKVNELALLYFQRNLLSDKDKNPQQAREYLKKRDISLDTVQLFRIGYAQDEWEGLLNFLRSQNVSPQLMEKAGLVIPRDNRDGHYDRFRNRIIFPIFDTRGVPRAFGARVLESNGQKSEGGAKYINSPETVLYTKGHHLYGFHLAKEAIGQKDSVIVVEGYLDCISSHQAGVKNVVASLGTALTVEQIRLLRRYTRNIVMLFDADQAGESAMVRSLDLLIEEGLNVKVAALSAGDDPDSFIRKNSGAAFEERIAQARSLFDFKLHVLMKQYDARTIEGKADITKAILPTIKRFNDAVLISGYIKKLAGILNVPESAIWAESNKFEIKEPKFENRVAVILDSVTTAIPRQAEQSILKLLLNEESFISLTKEDISITDFQDHKIRDVISKIYDLFDKGEKINLGSLLPSIADEQVQNLITRLMAEDEIISTDKNKLYRDCVSRLKKERLKIQRQEVLEQIRMAEQSGNENLLYELKEKFNQLIKG